LWRNINQWIDDPRHVRSYKPCFDHGTKVPTWACDRYLNPTWRVERPPEDVSSLDSRQMTRSIPSGDVKIAG
jgi:hypothetical protein